VSKWISQKIGNLAFVKGGKRLPKGHNYTPEVTEHPYLRVVDFKNNSIDVLNLKYLSNETASKIERYTIGCEDVYISIAGTIGLVGTIPPECEKANLTENAAKLVIKDKSIIDKNYLVTYLSSTVGQKQIQTKTITTAQPKLALFRIEDLEIPLLPLETQKQIAQTLKTAAELLALRKQHLVELDNLVESVFYDMFGDPVTNEKGWDSSTVDKVCSKIMGGGTPSKSHSEYYMGNIPWVTPKDMKTIWIKDSIDHINEDAIENSSAKLIPSNSILMVIRSGILKNVLPVAINTVDIAINQDMKAFITNEKVIKEYLLYFFKLMQFIILKNVRAVTADNIEFSLIKNLKIPVPPVDLQIQFATIVTKIEGQKALVKKAIDETQYLFESLMSEYFE
jgi:type I restriction enzyme S subunit